MKLFAAKGFDGATVSELEEAVGLKPGNGSFYRHFADKEELLEAVLEHQLLLAKERRKQEQGPMMDPSSDIREALTHQLTLALKGYEETLDLAKILMQEYGRFPNLMKRMRKEFIGRGAETVAKDYAERIAAGDMVKVDPVMLSTVIQSALSGYANGKSISRRPKDDAFIETLVELLVRKK